MFNNQNPLKLDRKYPPDKFAEQLKYVPITKTPAPPAGFQPAWAARANRVIGTGVS